MRKLCFLLFCCLIMANITVAAEEMKFNDINGHWAENVIEKWQGFGYINGYPDGSFKPDNLVTRAELSKILSSAFHLKENEQLVYEDVAENEWYYSYLKKSAHYIPTYPLPTLYESNMPYHENILNNGNSFLPNEKAIRMHVAEALVEIKLSREKIIIEELSIQEVNAQVQEVFKDAEYSNLMATMSGIPQNVQRMNRYTWLVHKLGIMIGDNGYFYPYGYITRAELLTAIDRIIIE